ncbi:MAG TPA: glycosyltransferase, partial [Saprospiraceae bacterium]|nr:glycosyltransferase [Saprospiraceae bacterium]
NNKIANAPCNIQFTGLMELDQMPELYASADMMLFPSYQENCPLAPIEAAAFGMPVIYRDIEEYSTLYEYPYLKAKTNEEFIVLIKRLSEDECFYQEAYDLSTNLIKQFEKEEIYKKILNVYSELTT